MGSEMCIRYRATPSPTAMPTAVPTATPSPTAQPTATRPAMAQVPVSPRLRVAVATAREQYTIPYAQSQVSEKLIPIYSHLIGRNITTSVEEPQLAPPGRLRLTARLGISPSGKAFLSIGTVRL